MKITPRQYARSLFESVQDKEDGESGRIIEEFVRILARNNDLDKGERVIAEFVGIRNKAEGVVEAEAICANEPDRILLADLIEYVRTATAAARVNLTTKTDKNLLGGAILKYGDKVWDGSLKTRVRMLKNELMK